jgi:hypothetical protein
MEMAYTFFLLAVIVAVLFLLFCKFTNKPLRKKRIVEIFLLSFLVISVGLGSIWAFIGHFFLPYTVSASIGWSPSPFELEVGFANLAIGVLGILCLWIRGNFWTATVISSSIFLLGAAYGHIINMMQYANYAPGNAGAVLYMDIFGPAILILLLLTYKAMEKEAVRNAIKSLENSIRKE